MTEKEYTDLGPLSRSIRMNRILSRLSCSERYKRSTQELEDLAEVAPLMDIEYAAAEAQYRFALKDTVGKSIKIFEIVDRGVLREKTRKGNVYWIDTASGRYVSTKGDYFEYILKDPDDEIRFDAWHLRKYNKRGWTDIKREGADMQYMEFHQAENGAVFYQRKITKDGVIVSLTQNGKPVPFTTPIQKGERE